MANNRLYIVDTTKNEYLCIAKGMNYTWNTGNIDLYQEFLNTRFRNNLILGTENDEEFYEKWIRNGENYNATNKWE